MAISLSAAAHGVFSAEPSLTNRSGRFTVMRWSSKPSREHSPATCNDCEKDDSNVGADTVGKLASPRIVPCVPKSATTAEHEPDAEPVPLNSPRSTERSREMEKRHEEALHCLTAQLMDAKEQVERLKTSQHKLTADVASEHKGRKEAEDLASKLQSKCRLQEQSLTKLRSDTNRLCKEKAGLEKTVHKLRKAMASKSSSSSHSNNSLGSDFDRLAVQMAETECAPLKRCQVEEKTALKKKLLLKWHPDKQPSAEHSKFATRVVQEMQNHVAWQE